MSSALFKIIVLAFSCQAIIVASSAHGEKRKLMRSEKGKGPQADAPQESGSVVLELGSSGAFMRSATASRKDAHLQAVGAHDFATAFTDTASIGARQSQQEKQETFILNKESDNKKDAEDVSDQDAEDDEDFLDEEDEDAEDGNHDDEEENKLDSEAVQTGGEEGKGGALLKPETKRLRLLHTDGGAPPEFVRDHGGPQKCEHVFNSSQCATKQLWRLARNACHVCNHALLWRKDIWQKASSSRNLCKKVGQQMNGTDSIMLDFDRRRRSTGKACWHPSLLHFKRKNGRMGKRITWDDEAASFERKKTLCRCMQSFTEKCANDGIACLKDRVCRCPAVCPDFKKHAGCKASYVYPTGSEEAATGASVNDELLEAALARSQRDGGAADASESTLDDTNRIKEC